MWVYDYVNVVVRGVVEVVRFDDFERFVYERRVVVRNFRVYVLVWVCCCFFV